MGEDVPELHASHQCEWRMPEARKRALLLHCLGSEGQRLYTLPNSGDRVADAIKTLEEHFIPKINVVVERHTFRD